jgi:adenosylcobinamide kinase/adenosylcobinamide-phosphate guanylyltransferase
MDTALTFILGGARSGKSRFAQQLAARLGRRVTFVATAEARDEEMRLRIEEHRRARPEHWRTVEMPLRAAQAVRAAMSDSEVVVLDCLSLLVSNLLLAAEEDPAAAAQAVETEISALVEAAAAGPARSIIVSNEVGMGVVPAYPLGRVYRDLLGWANARVAKASGEVYWMVAGLPVEIKASGLAATWEDGSDSA